MERPTHDIVQEALLELEYLRICQLEEIGEACYQRGAYGAYMQYVEEAEAASRRWIRRVERC